MQLSDIPTEHEVIIAGGLHARAIEAFDRRGIAEQFLERFPKSVTHFSD